MTNRLDKLKDWIGGVCFVLFLATAWFLSLVAAPGWFGMGMVGFHETFGWNTDPRDLAAILTVVLVPGWLFVYFKTLSWIEAAQREARGEGEDDQEPDMEPDTD